MGAQGEVEVETPGMPADFQESYSFPCTVVQQTCWYLDRISPGTSANNVAVRFSLQGPVRSLLMEEALRQICQRHEVLRTRFVFAGNQVRQIVEPEARFRLGQVDLRSLSPTQRAEEVDRLSDQEAKGGFNLETGPLFRGELLRVADEHYVLLLTVHHIVSDGWSIGIITSELGELYEALLDDRRSSLSDLPVQYADYACWQEGWLESGELETKLDQLKQKLDGFEPLAISTDFERPSAPVSKGEIRSIVLPRELTDSAKKLSDSQGCTLFVTMLTALMVLLQVESDQDDLTIRTQSAGRDQLELEGLIGWFVNSVVLRVNASGQATFLDLLKAVQREALASIDFQQVPFEKLMEVVRPRLKSMHQPPFQVNFIFQRDFVRPWKRGGVELTAIPSKATGTFVDLNLFLVERADGWRASVDINTDVFHRDTGDLLLASYKKILEAAVKNPLAPVHTMARRCRTQPPTVAAKADVTNHSIDNYVPPRNDVEKAIVEIWKTILNVPAIGVYSNFFDLGGHSLLAVTMLAKFRERFGFDIEMPQLFIDPTPAAMAQVVSGEEIYSDPRDIIPISIEGTKPPFFMIGGDHWFRPLARSIGSDQPFFGVPLLKYRKLDLSKERLKVAKSLAELLRAEHGEGPFFLGGWCADGITAFEVARELDKQGASVGLVVLFDATNPDYYREARALVNSAGRTMTGLRSILSSASQQGLWSSFTTMPPILGSLVRRIGQRVKVVTTSSYSCPEVQFPLLLVRPPAGPLEEPALGWRRVSPNALSILETPGDHSSIFKEPHVNELGRRLRSQLESHQRAAAQHVSSAVLATPVA
jgi:thioesterase domain-containing protein